AVLATTLSLVVIFIPVSFMSSIAGRFLYQFGITAAAAVLVSLLISFTLTPMMCARMLRVSGAEGSHDGARSRQGFYRWIDGDYSGTLSSGRIYVQLVPHEERVFSWVRLMNGVIHADPFEAFRHNYSQRDVMTNVRRGLAQFRDLKFQVNNIQSINLSVGGRTDINLTLRGPDIQKLVQYGEALAARGPELGLLDAQVSLQLNRPELHLQIDRQRAADLETDVANIASAMRIMVGGDEKVSRFHDTSVNQEYDVELRLAEGSRNDLDTISRLYVPSRTGKLIRLDNLVRVVPTQSVSQISRFDRER